MSFQKKKKKNHKFFSTLNAFLTGIVRFQYHIVLWHGMVMLHAFTRYFNVNKAGDIVTYLISDLVENYIILSIIFYNLVLFFRLSVIFEPSISF